MHDIIKTPADLGIAIGTAIKAAIGSTQETTKPFAMLPELLVLFAFTSLLSSLDSPFSAKSVKKKNEVEELLELLKNRHASPDSK